jgi:4-diphosphocytidyl-2C-methyl-D-erythritol kinase
MASARLGVLLGAAAGAAGGSVAAAALYFLARRRLRRLMAQLAQLDRDVELAADVLALMRRSAATGKASGDAMPPAGEAHSPTSASSGGRDSPG